MDNNGRPMALSRADVPPDVMTMTPVQQVDFWDAQGYRFRINHAEWAEFYVDSFQHKGLCCSSCIEDLNEGWQEIDPEWCCCRATRAGGEVADGE